MLDDDNNIVDTDTVADVIELKRWDAGLLCRGRRKQDGVQVLVKSFSTRFPSAADVERLRHEYEIDSALLGCPNLLHVSEVNPMYLTYDDPLSLVTLESLLASGLPTIPNLLHIVVQVCDGLAFMHKKMYIHGAVNLNSILVNTSTFEAKIFNLSCTTKLKANRVTPTLLPQGQDLAFISPEQTGRFGHNIDFRTDLYSLGILIYTLATGAPPFGYSSATDDMNLIHSHIAKPPLAPHTVNSAIPLALSQVIQKLIEKSPAQRYQSAIGVRNDLVHCLHDLQLGQTRRVFELGTSDVMPAPQASKILYGRDAEQLALTEILTRTSSETAVVFVVGGPGCGKTSLVRSIAGSAPGLFASSTCDEEGNRPYESVIACIRSLLMQTMGQGDSHTFLKWKARIVNLCGPNTEILLEVLPELGPILSPPMPLEDLPPKERRVRFNMLVIGILKIIAEEYPICMFIDDMHLADPSSLELILMLVTQSASVRLTFIFAFRDDVLTTTPPLPLNATLTTLEPYNPISIKVTKLAIESTEQLIASALSYNMRAESPSIAESSQSPSSTSPQLHSPDSMRSLAQAIQGKTDGNPFYTVRFLSQLHQFGHISWNWDRVGWDWDIVGVRNMPFSEDTTQWLSSPQTLRITPELQRMLNVAAVAGGSFPSRVLVELAHLFLEDSPQVSDGEEDFEGSVGGSDSEDETSSAGSSASEMPAATRLPSPSLVRPPSLTPLATPDFSRSTPPSPRPLVPPPPPTITSIASRSIAPLQHSNSPITSPTSPTSTTTFKPAPPPLTNLEVPVSKTIEPGRTPSHIDTIFQSYPLVPSASKTTLHSPPSTIPTTPPSNIPTTPRGVPTSAPIFVPTSPTRLPPSPTSVTPSTSPIRLNIVTTPPSQSLRSTSPTSPLSSDAVARLKRADSFPRVESCEDLHALDPRRVDNPRRTLKSIKQQRSFGTLPVPPSSTPFLVSPRVNSGNRRRSTDGQLHSPSYLNNLSGSQLSTSPTIPSLSHESTDNNSAWSNFPSERRYSGEGDNAMFQLTASPLHPGIPRVSSQEKRFRNKKYSAIVEMLINEAVTSSLLKLTEEQNLNGECTTIVSFTHDKIRQAALSQVSNRFARQVHLEYGNLLLFSGPEDLYSAVNHLNSAKKIIVSADARANLRRLNFQVGSTAKASGAHESALKYFKTGCDLVRPEEWKLDYAAVFCLSLAYAECEFLVGNRTEAMKMFEGLLVKAESISDIAKCYTYLVQVLVSSGDYMEAIRVSCECCRHLGWDTDGHPTHEQAVAYVKKIEAAVEAKSVKELMELKQTYDERVIALITMLLSMLDITYFINMDLFCVVSSKMVELTMEYGNSALSTGGYSMLSLAALGLQMSPAFAYKIDQVAMALLEKYSTPTSVRIKTRIMHTFAMYPMHHLRETIPFYEDAIQNGMHAGDFAYTVYAMIHKMNALYRTCLSLPEVLEYGMRTHDFVANKARFKDMALMVAGILYPACALVSDASIKPLITAKDMLYLLNKDAPLSSFNLTACGWALAGIMEGKYYEEKVDDAYEAGSVAMKMKGGLKGSLGMVMLCFYHSLSALAKYEKSPEDGILNEVHENQKFLGWWAENCQINGQHLYLLVEAEKLRVTGDAKGAMPLFEQAIALAHQGNYLNVEALAYELYAKLLLSQGLKVLASNTFTKAIEVYTLWGAEVKVDLLASKYGNLLDSLQHKTGIVDPFVRQRRFADLDMMIVVRSLQMLTQGIESHGLLDRFVTLVVQSASAEKGAVILRSSAASGSVLATLGPKSISATGEMKLAVLWDVRKNDKPNVLITRVPLSECKELPSDIINAVANTKQYVLIQNLQESDFNARNASMGPASVACLPIVLASNEVVGVMYLEHSASGVFSRERLHMLELLCVQLGMLLQNSSLYESVQESMQMYELLAESLPQMIFCHRDVDSLEYTNKIGQSYLGLTMDQLRLVFKYNFNETIHPHDYPDFIKAWVEAFGKAVTLTAEFRVKRASDNAYRWVIMRSVPVVDREGGTLIVSTISDIDDEHKAKERQLRISRIEASEKRYRLLSEAIPHIIWTTTQNGSALFFNSKWVEYSGMSLEDSYGFGWYHAVHPDDIDTMRKAWATIGTDRLEIEIRLRKWDGEYRWHLSRGIPCYEENSTNLVWFGTSTDINDNKVAAMVLTKAREAAEKAAANQALFLANMSHEIRTPLSGLTGMLDLLVDTPLNPEQHDYVDTMHHSAEGLLCIINDILDFSKIEAGKLQLQNEPFNPESAIEVVCEILSIMAATKDIELVFLVQPGVPAMLHGDPLRLRQVLMNLVGNAIKFTASGEVCVECSLIETNNETVTLLFTVQDTGCGMSPEDQKSLFNAFYQVDPSITRTHGGTGLGLAICKRLVDLFGGTISVQSAKGVGSTFSFSAQFKQVKDPSPTAATPRHKHTLSILHVADTPIIRKVIRFYLQHSIDGYAVSTQEAFNVVQVKDILKKGSTKVIQKFIVDVKEDQLAEVVSAIKEYIENPPPATIITPPAPAAPSSPPRTPSYFSPPRLSYMPTAASASPSNAPTTPTFGAPPNPFTPAPMPSVPSSSSSLSLAHHVPAIIIVTTPLKRSQYVKICQDVLQGCHANLRTLIKPITHTKIRVALATSPAELAAAGGEGTGVEEVDIAPSPPPMALPSPTADKKLKAPILIVEDNEVNQKVIRRHVEKWGMKCEVASNGAEAVRLVTQDRPPNYYCLALMDLFMPTVDGFEATRLIREWEHARAPGTLLYNATPFSPPISSTPSSPSNTRLHHGSEEGDKAKRRSTSSSNRLPIVVLTANVVGDIQEKIFQCGADDMLSKPVDFQKLRALVVHYSYLSL